MTAGGQKSTITIQAKLTFENETDKQKVLDLMRKWASCMRYAYNRLIEGYERNRLKRELQSIFGLNSRYVDDAILKAKGILSSVMTSLSPGRVLRDLSVLRPLLVSGQVGKTFEGRKFLFLGTGAMALSKAASWGLGEPEVAGYKYPSQTVQFCTV